MLEKDKVSNILYMSVHIIIWLFYSDTFASFVSKTVVI